MKIVYLITTSNWGGASEHVYELCKYELSRKKEIILIVGSKGLLTEKVKKLKKVRIIVLPVLKRNISPVNDFRATIILRKMLKEIEPDILHIHSSKAGVIGRIASRGLGIKTIFTVHGWSFTDGSGSRIKRSIYRTIEKIVRKYTDLFICVSKYDQNIGRRDNVLNSKAKSVVIHNGAPQPTINDKKELMHNPVRFIMVARFSPQKDQDSLIEAVSTLPKNAYHLEFIGDGSTLNKCKKKVANLELENNITFLGFKDNVGPYLANSDVYVLSTHYEGLPIGIIEAMSYGKPIIATNVGGNGELVINNQNGYLVNNKDELVHALKKIIKNKNMISKMGHKSLSLYTKKFTLQKQMKTIDSYYKKLLCN